MNEEPFSFESPSGSHESIPVPTIEVSSLDDVNGSASGVKRYRTANKDNKGASSAAGSAVPTPVASDEPHARELGAVSPSVSEEPHSSLGDAADDRLSAKEKARKERELAKAQEKEAKKLKKLQKEAASKEAKEAKEAARTEQQQQLEASSASSSTSSAARKQEEKELKNKLEQSRQKVIELQKRVRSDEETLVNMEQRFTKQEQELKLKHAKELKALKKQLEQAQAAAPSSSTAAAGSASSSSTSSSGSSSSSATQGSSSSGAVAAAAATAAGGTTSSGSETSSEKADKKKAKGLDRDKSAKEKEEELQRLRKILAQLKTKYEEATQHNAKVKQQNIQLKEQLDAAHRTIDEQAHRLRQEATCGGVLDDVVVPPSGSSSVSATPSGSNPTLSSASKSLLATSPAAVKLLRTRRHRLDLDDADLVGSINSEFTMFVARRFLYIMVFLCVWSLLSGSYSSS